ncbi:FUSC family protein [Parenemella sanctibonifatiensis]|uniref:FUSC family protein n=1 Tax=Parenemella sanctibonifatiensis TaxID=2016505 RepID=A0A255EAQ5_9ACTN|nr:FUSC family protein [Parenemella sanctibonifatiensis]OYN88596.1 FUSC family protein [Parenemella sanctibonifatiensis]
MPDTVDPWESLRDDLRLEPVADRLKRLRARMWLIVQAAAGAVLAWVFAKHVIGHELPFFAPITAMVCLGLTYENRVRRVIELAIGVAIGVLVGDAFVHLFGSSWWQIFVVCVVAMSLAVLFGAGQLLMMQAGIQGVIITTLVAGDGEALNRWIDAAVGGGVALLIAVLAPMRSTTQRPRQRIIALVGNLAMLLTETAQSLRIRDLDRARAALATARQLSAELDEVRESTLEAAAAASVAPLLAGSSRRDVDAIRRLLTPLDLAIRNARVLVRRAESSLDEYQYIPPSYIDMIAELANATAVIQERIVTQEPLASAREDLISLARRTTVRDPRAGLSAEVMRAQIRSIVVDLLVLSGMSLAQARRRVPPTREELDPG